MWQGDANVKGRTAGRYQGAASVPGGERLFSSGLLTGCLLTTISLDRKRGGHHPVYRQWQVGGECGGKHERSENGFKTAWGLDTERLTL